ncbi:MAG: magnesium/cobalt transporter CorA [Spirochaetaceae bacterium]|nr:MAG: magnesium/cobalt transporter CorA [Spirochaetaceae bacterium]
MISRRVQKTGLAPGTPVYTGDRPVESAKITVFQYDETYFKERQLGSVEECKECKDSRGVVWINIDGIHDISVVETVAKIFGIHPLVQEDIVSIHQRPKVEEYDSYLFAILKMLYQEPKTRVLQAEQVSMIVTPKIVISFQEREGDVFAPLRERIRNGKGIVRQRGSDYLAYCIIDAIVDYYFLIMEDLEDRILPLEKQVIDDPDPHVLQSIHSLKYDLVFMRRSLWPLREMLVRLYREQLPLVQPDTQPFLRDVHDHTIQIIEILESFQEIVSGLMDVHLTSISNRMNSIMKVLTIIATIFIPLTFIAGVYGMNFQIMPELSWPWGYPAVLGVMALVFIGMLIFFKRKKWL